MTNRTYLLLFILALGLAIGIASFQSTPGYLDGDYYYATGLQLAQGKGFTEPFLWNYLDDPEGLPHPSHAYWMPLASILSALGMRIARGFDFASAQWIFILLSALIPLITAALAFSLTSRRDLSLIAAFLALFSGYYAPFLTTTDTFTIYMLLGGGFLLALKIRQIWLKSLILGFLAGLMHLSRADGVIWLIFAFLSLIISYRNSVQKQSFSSFLFPLFLIVGYLLPTLPWFLRNLDVFGTILAPGGGQMLWLTSYNQIFSYPAGSLTMETWLASGWSAIFEARFWALKLNLGTILGVQGEIILLPFIIWGAWQYRKNELIRIGSLAWLTTALIMTIIFPFAGARGSFFHSGAALQPLWWALAPVGLEQAIIWISRLRGWRLREAWQVFRVSIVVISLILTLAILWGRVISPSARKQAQNRGVPRYALIEKVLSAQKNNEEHTAVIVSNPPGYYLSGGRGALALPDGDAQTVLDIATRYDAGYLILEPGAVTQGLIPVFDAPATHHDLLFLKEIEGAKIFVIKKQP